MPNLDHDALSTVEAYHQAWTSGDIERALTYVSKDVRCFAPAENLPTKTDRQDHLTALVPPTTGPPHHSPRTADSRMTLS